MSFLSNVDVPVALTIAGSDSGGGAGIQADLKTFSFHQVHGTSALTCVTAQNTVGVTRVDPLPPDAVIAQIEAVTGDMNVQAAKTGMLLNEDIISAVAQHLKTHPINQLVVDPVMVSRTGAKLIDEGAITQLTTQLIPLATILTPNRYEAQILADMDISDLEGMKTAAQKIHAMGPNAVIVKGGGLSGKLRSIDVWFDGKQIEAFEAQPVDTENTHGTGCTLSSAIAANLARGLNPLSATIAAKQYVTQALQHALSIGKGQGPIGHFYPLLTIDSGNRRP